MFIDLFRIQAAQRGVETRVAEEHRSTAIGLVITSSRAGSRGRRQTVMNHGTCQDKPPVAHMMMPLASKNAGIRQPLKL